MASNYGEVSGASSVFCGPQEEEKEEEEDEDKSTILPLSVSKSRDVF